MKSNYAPLIVAVFLVVVGLVSTGWNSPQLNTIEVKSAHYSVGLLGIAQAQDVGVTDSAAVVQSDDLIMDAQAGPEQPSNQQLAPASPTYASAAIQDAGQPIGQAVDPSQDSSYTVKKGDTLSGVAAQFNVSVSSILSANPNIRKKTLTIGEVITIPGTAESNGSANAQPALPNFNGYFILPAQGNDTGILDSNNGVDIINACGTPVVAAADGVVVPDPSIADSLGGWNDGYGNFVLIEQAFGNDIFTRYAHLQSSLVQIGSYVKQGQEIGLMGQSGGASACELDFEVIGAQNPFSK